jgi:CheY-like chemotaxis protein
MKKLQFVLLVDDDDSDNEFHVEAIKNSEIALKIEVVMHPEKALAYFETCLAVEDTSTCPVPDLVFLDVNMPALNGFDVLDELRKLPDPYGRRSAMVIMMLTGSTSLLDSNRADNYTDLVRGFYVKPLTSTLFLKIAQTHFAGDPLARRTNITL